MQVLKLNQLVKEECILDGNILREIKKQRRQTEITMYFHKCIRSVPSTPAYSFTSSTFSASTTPETTRPTALLLPPPQSSQWENNEDKGLHVDPLPLNRADIFSHP